MHQSTFTIDEHILLHKSTIPASASGDYKTTFYFINIKLWTFDCYETLSYSPTGSDSPFHLDRYIEPTIKLNKRELKLFLMNHRLKTNDPTINQIIRDKKLELADVDPFDFFTDENNTPSIELK